MVTPQQARQELARRELVKRETTKQTSQPQLSQVTPEQYGTVGRALTRLPGMPALPMQERFEQGLGRGIGAGVNALGFNMPNALMRKMGVDILPPSTTPEQKAGEFAGTIAGTMASPITKGAMALGKVPQTARLLTKVGRGALGGAVAGGAYTPTENPLGLAERGKQAAMGGLAGGLISTVGAFKQYLNPKVQNKLAEDARNSLLGSKNQMIEKYGESYNKFIKNREGQISIQEPLINLMEESDDIVNTLKGNQEVSEALRRGDTSAKRVMSIVEAFISNPKDIPSNLTLKEADSIQKYIKNLPGIRNKLSMASKRGFEQVDFNNAERVLLNFANDIKAQVLNLAPEMTLVNKEYGQFMNNFKQVRPYLKWGTATDNFKRFTELNSEVRTGLEVMLPKSIINKIITTQRVSQAKHLLDMMGIGAAYGTGAALSGYALYNVTKKR
jgi:hypothetical protein